MCLRPQVITPPDSANRVISQLVDQYASQTGALMARAKEVSAVLVLLLVPIPARVLIQCKACLISTAAVRADLCFSCRCWPAARHEGGSCSVEERVHW